MSARLKWIALLAAGLAAGGAVVLGGWPPSRTAEGPAARGVATTESPPAPAPLPVERDAPVQPAAASEDSAATVSPVSVAPTGDASGVETAVGDTPLPEATGFGPTSAGPPDDYAQSGAAELEVSPTTVSPEGVQAESPPATPLDSHPTLLPSVGSVGSIDAPGIRPEASPTGATDPPEPPGQ